MGIVKPRRMVVRPIFIVFFLFKFQRLFYRYYFKLGLIHH